MVMLYKITHNLVHLLIWLMQDETALKVKGFAEVASKLL